MNARPNLPAFGSAPVTHLPRHAGITLQSGFAFGFNARGEAISVAAQAPSNPATLPPYTPRHASIEGGDPGAPGFDSSLRRFEDVVGLVGQRGVDTVSDKNHVERPAGPMIFKRTNANSSSASQGDSFSYDHASILEAVQPGLSHRCHAASILGIQPRLCSADRVLHRIEHAIRSPVGQRGFFAFYGEHFEHDAAALWITLAEGDRAPTIAVDNFRDHGKTVAFKQYSDQASLCNKGRAARLFVRLHQVKRSTFISAMSQSISMPAVRAGIAAANVIHMNHAFGWIRGYATISASPHVHGVVKKADFTKNAATLMLSKSGADTRLLPHFSHPSHTRFDLFNVRASQRESNLLPGNEHVIGAGIGRLYQGLERFLLNYPGCVEHYLPLKQLYGGFTHLRLRCKKANPSTAVVGPAPITTTSMQRHGHPSNAYFDFVDCCAGHDERPSRHFDQLFILAAIHGADQGVEHISLKTTRRNEHPACFGKLFGILCHGRLRYQKGIVA